MAIIKNKATSLGLDMPDDVCAYIAENVTSNVRQIEGTVKKIMAYQKLNGMNIDVPSVSRAIKDMYKGKTEALPTPSLIISEVSRFYSIPESTLRGTLKNKGTAEARQVAMYLIRQLTNLSLPDIGREFGKDHSTVIYAIRKVEKAMDQGAASWPKPSATSLPTSITGCNKCDYGVFRALRGATKGSAFGNRDFLKKIE